MNKRARIYVFLRLNFSATVPDFFEKPVFKSKVGPTCLYGIPLFWALGGPRSQKGLIVILFYNDIPHRNIPNDARYAPAIMLKM